VLTALNKLINEFNYPRIYRNPVSRGYSVQTENMLRALFKAFMSELDDMRVPENNQVTLHRFQDPNSDNPLLKKSLGELEFLLGKDPEAIMKARVLIIKENLESFKGSRTSMLYFLKQMNEEYWVSTRNAQMAIDYLTLMTDSVATAIFESQTIPRPVV
jgi:dGTP triphosphohydrolase